MAVGEARLPRRLALALVALGPAALFGPMLVRGEVLYWGTPLLQFVPWHTYALDLVRHGSLPLWNPLLGMGAPLLANYQSALLYPPNWLLAITVPGWGEGFLVAAHLVFSGVGMVLLLRRLERGLLGQVVGATAFASSSYLVSRSGFFSLNATASWLPWLVLAADRAVEASRSHAAGRWAKGIAVLSAVMAFPLLAGHAQSAGYSLLLSIAWLVWRSAESGLRAAGRSALIWIAAFGLAAGLAAAQLLPTIEYLRVSSRSTGLDEAAALTYSFWPWRTLGLIAPGLFGSPAQGDYWGYGNYWEDALYIGVLPLLMAIGAAVRAGVLGRLAGRTRTFLLVVALSCFVLALGSNTPIYPLLFRRLPLADLFNAPTRINLLTTWALAMLAGFGADLWSRPRGPALYWTRLGTAGAGAAMAVGILLTSFPAGLRESFGRATAWAGLWLLLAGVLTLAWPSRPHPRWLAVVGLVVTADLVAANWGLNPATPGSVYAGRSELSQAVGDGHRLYLASRDERVLKFERTHRFDSFQLGLDPRSVREGGLPNTSLLDRVPSANNFDPLVPDRYARWIRIVDGATQDGRSARLALMDVGWIASGVGETPPWVEYEAVEGAARVRVVPSAQPADGPESAGRIVSAVAFDPEAQVVLEAPPEVAGQRGGEGAAAVVETGDPGRVVIDVDIPQGGWVVLSDIWYPGWVAEVDGLRRDSYPADVAFRAVWAPPGSQRVVWTYRPASARNGAIVSGLSLTVVLAMVAWFARRRSA